MNLYQNYCKPALAGALRSVGLDKIFHRAKGQYLYCLDEDGNERGILDCLGGYGAILFGHNDSDIRAAMQNQLDTQTAFHNQFSLRMGSAILAKEINDVLQKEMASTEKYLCAFASTGAESVEVAIKHAEYNRGKRLDKLNELSDKEIEDICPLENVVWNISAEAQALLPELNGNNSSQCLIAIRDWNTKQFQRAPIFIALKHAFHGKLNTSIAMTYGERYRKPLRRFGTNTFFFDPAELTEATVKKFISTQNGFVFSLRQDGNVINVEATTFPLVSAILVEPVQGEGGVFCLNEEHASTLHKARELLDCPIISDEVQSGCGRCGSFLAGSQINLRPDYIVLSKALGGGLCKIGLVAIRESKYAQGFDIIQSSTFGEDDISAAVALAFVRKLLDNDGEMLEKVRERGSAIRKALENLANQFPDIIREIRGKGLLQGIVLEDLTRAPSHLIKTMADNSALGYIVTGHLLENFSIRIAPPASAGNVLRIEPCLLITDEDIQNLCSALGKIFLALRYNDTGYLLNYLVPEMTETALEPRDYRSWYQDLDTRENDCPADYKVAFINHLIAAEGIKDVDPSLGDFTDNQICKLVDRLSFDRRVAPFPPVRITSSNGKTVDFILYPINATSLEIGEKLAQNDLQELRDAIDDRLAVARRDGCALAGLGMFTSIVSNNGKAVETAGIKVTTGNALTVAMADAAIRKTLVENQLNVEIAAVVGAGGNIGSTYSTILADYCPKLILIGSTRSGSNVRVLKVVYKIYQQALQDLQAQKPDLKGIAASLRPYANDNGWVDETFIARGDSGRLVHEWFITQAPEHALIRVSGALDDLKLADLVVCSANASQAFISVDHLKMNSVICDIAVPHNLSESSLISRPDLTILRGGIVKTPNNESLDIRARAYLKEGQVYACMAETITLGLDCYANNFSYGNIDKSQVLYIQERAKIHGLSLAEYKQQESM